MSKKESSDIEIIEAIQSPNGQTNATVTTFYEETKQLFIRFMQKNNGNTADAEDLFQEGMQHLILNIRSGVFQQKSALKTYLFRICRNLWLSRLRRKNKWQDIQQVLKTETVQNNTPQILLEKTERKLLLDKALSTLSGACREVLSLWTLGYSMKEIAQKANYKNENSAKKKKSICLKTLVQQVKSQPELVKELLNHL